MMEAVSTTEMSLVQHLPDYTAQNSKRQPSSAAWNNRLKVLRRREEGLPKIMGGSKNST
jgi:hypothetical protein